jgi:hypothetical protein
MRILLLCCTSLLAACASRPPAPATIEGELDGVLRVENRERSAVLWTAKGFSPSALPLPEVRIAEGAALDELSAEDVAPVLRELGRSFCLALAERLPLVDEEGTVLRLEVVALRKSKGNAVSALLDLAVPGPGRLPAGLGGLSVRLSLLRGGEPAILYAWARGANALRENARLSPIADAWQLASRFPKDFLRDAALDRLPKRPREERRASEAACEARFGSSDPLLRGAGRFLPLPPEWADEEPKPSVERPPALEDQRDDSGAAESPP